MSASLPILLTAEHARRSITGWGWYWLFWSFIGFGVPEGYALATNTLNTLSWQIWGIEHENFAHPFDFADWTPIHWGLSIFFLLGFLWLFLHMTFGLLR